jgi:hypothetical protein
MAKKSLVIKIATLGALIGLGLLVAAIIQTNPRPKQETAATVDQREPGAICAVHRIPLQDDTVDILYTYVASQDLISRREHFPNACFVSFGSDYKEPNSATKLAKRAHVSFCRECRKAELAWAASGKIVNLTGKQIKKERPDGVDKSDTTPSKRRVYVLHAGMHIVLAPADKNYYVGTLRELLLKRGVQASDIVGLECPYPTASWSDVAPREGLVLYLGSTDPASRASQEAYLRLDKALQERKVASNDNLIWIGHSAGGQMGMTMANLAHNLDKYPELAKKAKPYHFDMVVTLGSAVGSNPVPNGVKLRHYYSSNDLAVAMLSKHGNVIADSLGFKVRFSPCVDLGANARIRVFQDVEHGAWATEPHILDRILHESESNYTPPWQRTQADIGQGVGLAQLLAKSLDSTWNISLEENPNTEIRNQLQMPKSK